MVFDVLDDENFKTVCGFSNIVKIRLRSSPGFVPTFINHGRVLSTSHPVLTFSDY